MATGRTVRLPALTPGRYVIRFPFHDGRRQLERGEVVALTGREPNAPTLLYTRHIVVAAEVVRCHSCKLDFDAAFIDMHRRRVHEQGMPAQAKEA